MPDVQHQQRTYGALLATGSPFDVRVVVFTLARGELLVALRQLSAGLSLPRDVPIPGEPLERAARRVARTATRMAEQYLEQLYTFSFGEECDGVEPSIVVAYTALICSRSSPPAGVGIVWRSAARDLDLKDADRTVLDYALMRLRAKLGYTNIAFHLLAEKFTLTELQNAYETILGSRLDKRNFRRRMIASGILEETAELRREGSHRPAALYRFRADLDTTSYLTPAWTEPEARTP
jgi:8-oxo-dGTP diphosphatase